MNLLDGIRVVSFNHFLLGPLSSQLLGDLGADVIAVESLDGSFQRHWASGDIWIEEDSVFFLCANRSKRSIALDLKSDEGRKIALELIKSADVVSENFRPGVMEKFGLGYDDLKKDHPGLIFASGSGYGREGPLADYPGQDLLAQAMSGLASVTGANGGNTAVGSSVVDHHGAALLTMGILAALVARSRTGEGRRVDVDLLSAAIDLQTEPFTAFLNAKTAPNTKAPSRVAAWYYPAPYGIYRASDGALAISFADLAELARLLDAPELAALGEDAAKEMPERVSDAVASAIAKQNVEHWQKTFTDAGIWHAPVLTYADVAAHPQVAENRTIIEGKSTTGQPIRLVAHPVKYDGARPGSRLDPQPLGAQTREILGEIGYHQTEIDRLIAEKKVG